jgi:transposase-like protein
MGRVSRRAKYPKEFKLEVIRRLEDGEKSQSELCRELGLSQQMVGRWRLQLARKGEAKVFPGIGSTRSKSSEVAELKQELARLKEENEILKKAAAYFARDVR